MPLSHPDRLFPQFPYAVCRNSRSKIMKKKCVYHLPAVGAERGSWKSLFVAQVGNGQLVPAKSDRHRLRNSFTPNQNGIPADFCPRFVKGPVLAGNGKPR
jgi:hypothetical protein